MELKVWVDGIQRIVCGVTEGTSCQDVVIALAHATGKTGRFCLLEKWRENERLLAPQESPLKLLGKWGEFANDVHFVLRKSEQQTTSAHRPGCCGQEFSQQQHVSSVPAAMPQNSTSVEPNIKDTSIHKSLTFSGGHGIKVQNVENPQKVSVACNQHEQPLASAAHSSSAAQQQPPSYDESQRRLAAGEAWRSPQQSMPSPQVQQFNKVVIKPFRKGNIRDSWHATTGQSTQSGYFSDIGTGMHETSPEYSSSSSDAYTDSTFPHEQNPHPKIQTQDLLKLVHLQNGKLKKQLEHLGKYDLEIQHREKREREYNRHKEIIETETEKLRTLAASYSAQIQEHSTFNYSEEIALLEESGTEILSEISLVRSKLANCEKRITQEKHRTEELDKDLESEKQLHTKAKQEQDKKEKEMLAYAEETQLSLDELLAQASNLDHKLEETTKSVEEAESNIEQRRHQTKQLLEKIRKANMESFQLTETINDLSGSITNPGEKSQAKNFSNRKMKFQPQKLGTAVPTQKNPNGVWV